MPRLCRFTPYVLFLASLTATAQSGTQEAPSPHPAKWSPKAQEMFVSYWTLEPGWTTELEVRNNIARRDLTVTPVLRTLTGKEITLEPVTVPPEHVAAIDLRRAVSIAAPELLDRGDSLGSVVCRYSSNNGSNLFAATMVQRSGTPIAFHFDSEPVDAEWKSGSMEGIWWLPRSTASDYLILSNASAKPLVATVEVTAVGGSRLRQDIRLGPAQTARLDMRAITEAAHLAGSEGGVSVSAASGAGALIVSHIVFDETTGMSATMKTFERNPSDALEPLTLRAPMMALAEPDPVLGFPERTTLIPQLFLRNATSAPLNASLALNWRSNSGANGRVPLGSIQLAAGEVRVLTLSDLTAKAQLPADAFWGTLVLKYPGRSGDLVPVATSFDGSGRYGLQTPFSGAISHLWKGSMWHVEVARDSLITAGNGGSEPTRTALTLFYNNGKSSYTMEKLLEPDEQIWADLGEIIRDQIPDKDGKRIPPDTMMGSYELRDLDHLAIGNLYEGKLVLDKSWGHAYYGCSSCCGYTSAVLGPDPFSGAVSTGGSNQMNSLDCMDNEWNFANISYGWGSLNTGVATLANAYTNLVGVGSTNGFASVNLETMKRNCPKQVSAPRNTVNSAPTVTIQVQSGFVSMSGNGLVLLGGSGGLNTTAVTATGHPSGGSFTWSAGPRLQISGVNSANASVSGTAPSTSGGDTYVSVTYSMNSQSGAASERFTVVNPTSLVAASYPGGSPYTTPYSSGSNSGYLTTITYYFYDQMSPANLIDVPGVPLTEILSTISNPFGGQFNPPDNTPRTAGTDASGAVLDFLYAYAPGGLPKGFSASRSQSFTGNGFPFSPAQQQTYSYTFATVATQTLHR